MLAAATFVLVTIAASALFTVDETQQVLVLRTGAPVGVIVKPGLQVKVPFIDTAIYYDTRLQSLEPPTEQVILGDQKRIEVQTYTRYRVADPLRFFQSLRTVEQAGPQLAQLVSASLRRALGRITLPALLSAERVSIVDQVQREVAGKALALGIEVVEVRFHRADLPLETSQAIYDRMKSERQREAKELRAQGFEWAQQIQAKAERERTVILSEAQRQAKITRGEADAAASRQLASAFDRDPQFYRFYRALQTYRQALAESHPTLVLAPDAEFLRFLRSGPGASASRSPQPP
jgi:membrane protease subunit HflC